MARQGIHAPLGADEFEALVATVVAQSPRMSAAQMLDFADRLHDLIRTRQAAERSFARRHAQDDPAHVLLAWDH